MAAEGAFTTQCQVAKVDEELGLVIGFGLVCKIQGEEYYDSQGDHITEKAMINAATDFMGSDRTSTDLHVVEDGQVVFAFPLTTDIAKALDIETDKTGLLIAMRPSAPVLAKFKSGEYTGFSIGGLRGEEEVVEQ